MTILELETKRIAPVDALAPSVPKSPRDLPERVLKRVRPYMRPDPVRFLFQLVLTWLSIAGTIAAALYLDNIMTTLLAVFFIGSRQNVLGLLMHEQVHRAAFRSPAGDLLANVFCAYPLVSAVEDYRAVHSAHHRYFFTDRDPDYRRKQGKDWTFPQKVRHFVFTMLRELAGVNLHQAIKSKRPALEGAPPKPPRAAKIVRPMFYGAAIGLVASTQTWIPFFIFWILPLATVLQAYIRWAAIAEHKYDLVNPSVVEATPIIELRWWEKLLLPNLNFTLHVYHHYWPSIPYAKLPAVHDIFRQEGLLDETNVFRGYGAYFQSLFRPKA